jgi:hypothetical protein
MNQFNIDTATEIIKVTENAHRYLQFDEDLYPEVLGRK